MRCLVETVDWSVVGMWGDIVDKKKIASWVVDESGLVVRHNWCIGIAVGSRKDVQIEL